MKSFRAAANSVALATLLAISASSFAVENAKRIAAQGNQPPAIEAIQIASDGYDRTPISRQKERATMDKGRAAMEMASDGFDRTPIARIS